MEIAMTAVALVWNHVVILNQPNESDSMSHPGLVSLRQAVKDGLVSIADAIESKHYRQAELLVADEASSEYVRLTTVRFNELQLLSAGIDS
jgi:hypothetical protein